MTNKEKEQIAEWHPITDKIFKNCATYLIGPKYDGKYVIEYGDSKSPSKIIRLPHQFGGASALFYFDSRIRINTALYGPDGSKSTEHWWEFQQNADPMPTDKDSYIAIISKFLRLLMGHVSALNSYDRHYGRMHAPQEFKACPDRFRQYTRSYAGLLQYEYHATDLSELKTISKWMSSREFKRLRGDYGKI